MRFYSNRKTEPLPPQNSLNSLNLNGTERLVSFIAGGWLCFNAAKNFKKNPLLNISKLGAAGYLIYRGLSANCPLKSQIGFYGKHRKENVLEIEQSIIVNKPVREIYQYWRRVGNLPSFMNHLRTVQEINAITSDWEAKVPGNLGTIKWQAEIINDIPNELIEWRSVPESIIENAGKVRFSEVGFNRTQIDVTIRYTPPAGKIGSSISRWLNPVFAKIIRNDIFNFKHHFETISAEEDRLTTYSRM